MAVANITLSVRLILKRPDGGPFPMRRARLVTLLANLLRVPVRADTDAKE